MRTGRSPKVSDEEKIAIVDRYFIVESDGCTSLLSKHGVFRRLSDYAKTLGYKLEIYDFSRSTAVRERIEQLLCNTAQDTSTFGIPTYEPLDIVALMMTGRDNIHRTLQDRESYYMDLHRKSAKAIENYISMSQLCTQYQANLSTLTKQNQELQTSLDIATNKLRSAMKSVGYLSRVIRKEVEPERAQRFLEGLSSRDVIVQIVEQSVTSNISKLIADDRKMQAAAQAEIDMLDINNLLK